MNGYAALIAADVRLVILRTLAEDPGYSLNESILQDVLAMFGHKLTRDRVRTEIRWLEEQGLVTVDTVVNVMVAQLAGRGADVASGAAHVDGVKRPRPK